MIAATNKALATPTENDMPESYRIEGETKTATGQQDGQNPPLRLYGAGGERDGPSREEDRKDQDHAEALHREDPAVLEKRGKPFQEDHFFYTSAHRPAKATNPP